jgi:hypothetical protein
MAAQVPGLNALNAHDLFSGGLIHSYVQAPHFVPRGWLAGQVQAELGKPGCRFVLLTAGPGTGRALSWPGWPGAAPWLAALFHPQRQCPDTAQRRCPCRRPVPRGSPAGRTLGEADIGTRLRQAEKGSFILDPSHFDTSPGSDGFRRDPWAHHVRRQAR